MNRLRKAYWSVVYVVLSGYIEIVLADWDLPLTAMTLYYLTR